MNDYLGMQMHCWRLDWHGYGVLSEFALFSSLESFWSRVSRRCVAFAFVNWVLRGRGSFGMFGVEPPSCKSFFFIVYVRLSIGHWDNSTSTHETYSPFLMK
jgi:hypothetical protein